MATIKQISAREILDSRGNPTVEVDVELEDGIMGTAAVPSGASTGIFEALELRDGDKSRFGGLGVLKAVDNVNNVVAHTLHGHDSDDQQGIDQAMIDLDGTENKSSLGANAILGVSLAVARASAISAKKPLYQYLAEKYDFPVSEFTLPIPMFNVINGGKHSDSGLSVQEYKIIPSGIETFKEQYRAGSEIFHALQKLLVKHGQSIGVGDEGGFAPKLSSNSEPLELINQAIELAGYKSGIQVNLGVDVAASSFFRADQGDYQLMPEDKQVNRETLVNIYNEWIDKHHVISVEDGLQEEDWDGWKAMNEKIGEKVMLIGDDLLVTNVKRLQKAIDEKACNAVLIKVNQIGSLSETMACIKLAYANNFKTVISHRSGETTDDFISDLAVATGAKYMKSGSLSRGERICKYNRLLRIEEDLK